MRTKKRNMIIIIIIILLILLLFPITLRVKDGGTVTHEAILYGVTRVHAFASEGQERGYNIGTRIRILWFYVYDDVSFVPNGTA